MLTIAQLRHHVQAWIDDDPDPASRDELATLVQALPSSEAQLQDRFSGPLTFGTAGLRGPLRAGPNGMNRAVVARAAAGLAKYLNQTSAIGPVVIGYDARYGSEQFAHDTAQLIQASGRPAMVLPRALPTPVLAFSVQHLAAAAGVMVTASHNPPADNGYKVYLGGEVGRNAQIVPPSDSGISDCIAAVDGVAELARDDQYEILDESIVEAYLDAAAGAVLPDSPRSLVTVSTALHGVGGPILAAAFQRAGFAAPQAVSEQQSPNPDFPGLAFPNPEEPHVMDAVIELAAQSGADVAIANDPDADRCAIAAVLDGQWRALRGDELGILLADHLIRRGEYGTYATTIVSSSLLGKLCQQREVPYAATLTGFKWIVRAPDSTGVPLRFGYEEAIGYCVDPASVNDKDGITAALLVAELAATLKQDGSSLGQRLADIYAEFGFHRTDQVSVRVEDLSIIAATMARLREQPPTTLAQWAVRTEDLLPATDGLIVTGDGVRVVIRPSGTEPKLKAYLEVVDSDADRANHLLRELKAVVTALIG